ncbi:hypothetical protein BGI36_03590 [Snodgrassella communis]|uniref:hypothetical protein n=1 Tax=Snodgrassella communis TaxID=2946699 RepID=UPI000C1E3BD9|nr:hypothetical protein [Snodgrassella communis]PIT22412.1 hypothetical protein BGI36_03590 [Snodgrassella communis]
MSYEDLNANWRPDFGAIFYWFSMDKSGKIAVMVNNCWGDLPKALLSNRDSILLLGSFMDYIFEDSDKFNPSLHDKHGETILDLYSGLVYRAYKNRKDVEARVASKSKGGKHFDESVPARKGLFYYEAIEGSEPGEDFVVGYDGETKMGDYFREFIPTICSSIEDFPKELRPAIAVSDTVHFTKDRLFDNDKISEYFPRMYS